MHIKRAYATKYFILPNLGLGLSPKKERTDLGGSRNTVFLLVTRRPKGSSGFRDVSMPLKPVAYTQSDYEEPQAN